MSHNNAKSLGIFDYIEILINYKSFILKITLASIFISIIFSLLLKNKYSSTALILPPQHESGIIGMLTGQMGGNVSNLASNLLGKGSQSDLYASILDSDEIKDKIIDRFNLMSVYNQKYRLDTYNQLDKYVNIQVGKKDGIISISVIDTDPRRATDIANAFVEELGKHSVRLNMDGAKQHRSFIEDRLIKAKADLEYAEDNLKKFQSRNKAIDVTEQTKGTIKGIADIMSQLALEEIKLSAFKRQFTESSQEVKTQREIIKNMKVQISKLETLSSTGTLPSIAQVPALGQEFVRIMREFKIQETLVELLTKQNVLATLDEANNESSIQIIQKAKVPDKKRSPKRSLIVLSTALFFFISSLLLCFIIEFIKRLPESTKDRMVTAYRHLNTYVIRTK